MNNITLYSRIWASVAYLLVISLITFSLYSLNGCSSNRVTKVNSNNEETSISSIFNAVVKNDISKIKLLLKENPSVVFIKDEYDRIPLYYAVENNNKDVSELLLANKSDINARDKSGSTSLHIAAAKGYLNVAALLIANKADVNGKANNGDTPLHKAVNNGHKEVIELLLSYGADVNAIANNGETPLHKAVKNDHKEVIELLLSHGAYINVKDNNGLTPLYKAAAKNNEKVVSLLLSYGAYVNDKVNNNGETLLHIAAFNDQEDIINLLLLHGADVNAKDNNGLSPLCKAADKGYVNVVKLLMSYGADVNVKINSSGDTSLHKAAFNGHKGVVEFLLSHGANLNTKNIKGETPLHKAAFNGQMDVVNFLLANKADVNAKDNNGLTPLYNASSKGNVKMVEVLLSSGATADVVDNTSWSALIYMISKVQDDNDCLKIVKLLVDKSKDNNQATQNGKNALRLACIMRKFNVAIYLYERGATLEDSSLEGIELNGMFHHILGDNYFSLDKLDLAKASYTKARYYYSNSLDKYSGDVTKIAWQQFGQFLGKSLLIVTEIAAEAAVNVAARNSTGNNQLKQISALRYANQTHTGIRGYETYLSNSNKNFAPNYNNLNVNFIIPPSENSSIDEKKAYAEVKSKYYENNLVTINKTLFCFDKMPNKTDILACLVKK